MNRTHAQSPVFLSKLSGVRGYNSNQWKEITPTQYHTSQIYSYSLPHTGNKQTYKYYMTVLLYMYMFY